MRVLVDYTLQKKRKKNTDLENIGKETIQNEAHRIIILN